jgi:glycosyltransferase involved in cell wall biosynthesis
MTVSRRPKVVHVVDDAALGGVSRMLDVLLSGLGDWASHERIVVSRYAMIPPSLRGVDVVVVHVAMAWSKLPLMLALRLRMGSRPIILVEHSYTAALERELVTAQSRFRCLLRTAYRLADRVVSVSNGQAQWMRTAGLVQAPKLVCIPPVSQCDGLADLPLPDRCGPDRCGVSSLLPLRLGASGRFCQAKGFTFLLEAMALLKDAPVRLTLAGYGEDEAALRAQAEVLSNVEMMGPSADPIGFLGAVDAVVVPSLWEAFGLLAMEARLAGRPVIVSDLDGLTEQVSPTFGYTVPSKDPAGLARAIAEVCRRDLAPMGRAARQSALTHTDDSLAAWSKLLLSVLPQDVAAYSSSQHQFAT